MSKSIIIYYTWSGRTREMAETLARLTGGELQELLPVIPYPKNYNQVVVQAKEEIQRGDLPAIEKMTCDLSLYDTVFLGTPVWWGTMAPPLAAFLKEAELGGKRIFPFCTHGGGGKGHTDRDIARLCPDADIKEIYEAYEGGGRQREKQMQDWLKRNQG